MRNKMPNFVIESDSHERIVIRDVGPWDEFPSVTNGAEAVIEKLVREGRLPTDLPGKRVLYYDSEGVLDELVVEKGRFARFAFGPTLIALLLLAGVGCSEDRLEIPLADLYDRAVEQNEPAGPWFSIPGRDPEKRSIQSYSTYATILINESLRFQATGDADAQTRVRHAVEFFIANTDDDDDGVPGWGIQRAWNPFGLEVLPVETSYSVNTAYTVQALVGGLESGALDPEAAAETEQVIRETVLGWSERYFIDDGPGGFFLYSTKLDQRWFVPNVSALMGGAFAKFLALFPDSFAPAEAAFVRRTLVACAETLSETWRPESFSWPYSTFDGSAADFNDFGHHVSIVEGVELLREYLGADFPFTTDEAIESFGRFYGADGTLYHYPVDLRDAMPDEDPFNRVEPPVVMIQAAKLQARLGQVREAEAILEDVYRRECSGEKCPVATVNVAAILFGGDL